MELNSYELSRNLFDWSYENPEKINTNHIALYFFIIEHCNRLGWKEKFGLPTGMAKEAIGIRNYRTYINTLNDLIEFGFIKLIEKSKNQYSSNIVAIVKNTKAHTKALDKARSKHIQKQVQSIDSINKQYNKETLEQNNKETIDLIYSLYPSNCPNRKSSTGKCSKDKIKIEQLLKTRSKDELETIINNYIEDCNKSGTYLKNFGTFLNQLPEVEKVPEIIPELQITFRREGCLDVKVPLSNWAQTKKMYGPQIIWTNELEILGKEIEV